TEVEVAHERIAGGSGGQEAREDDRASRLRESLLRFHIQAFLPRNDCTLQRPETRPACVAASARVFRIISSRVPPRAADQAPRGVPASRPLRGAGARGETRARRPRTGRGPG